MSLHTTSRLLSLFAASTLAFPLLTGCGMGHIDTTLPSAAIQGKVFGGQQPIGQSTITVWQVGTTAYGTGAAPLDQVVSDDNGNFSFPANDYTCPAPDTQVYITAAGGNPSPGVPNPNVLLAAGLGNCVTAQNQFVVINEVTTAATAYAMGQFLDPDYTITGTSGFGAPAADANYLALSNTHTIPMLVDLASGTARPSGNGITREDARLNTIANIIASCVNNSSLCTTLFNDTPGVPFTPGGTGETPTNTLQAAVDISLLPTQNVADLFGMPTGTAPFTGLATQPDDFLLSIAYTSSDFGLSINSAYPGGSSSSIDIDSNGLVYFPSNGPGKTGIGYFDPNLDSFGPLLVPNALTLPQYLAIDTHNNVFETDLGSGNEAAIVDVFSSPLIGNIDPDVTSSSAIEAPAFNSAIASETLSSGTSRIAVILPSLFNMPLSGITAPATGVVSNEANFFVMTSGASTPCSIESVNDDGTDTQTFIDAVELQTSGNCRSGGILSIFGSGFGIASSVNESCITGIDCEVDPLFNLPQAIARDGQGDQWAANSGNGSLYVAGNRAYAASIHPATLHQPYGVAIDGSGNVWLSNAGCVTTTMTPCDPGAFTLTEFIGAAVPTRTPLGANNYSHDSGTRPSVSRHTSTFANTNRFTLPAGVPTPWLH